MKNPDGILEEIVDRLIPAKKLDAYEQALYYFLVRESRLGGAPDVRISINDLGGRLHMTRRAIEPRLRSLPTKGCIVIVDTGWRGTQIRPNLPSEILGESHATESAPEIDIETVDFFTGGRYRDVILQRESTRCFYCLRALTIDNWSLDHVQPQVTTAHNSYRNIVAACHSCNSSKNVTAAEDFLRGLYRRGRLSDAELDQRLAAIELLRGGELKPIIPASAT